MPVTVPQADILCDVNESGQKVNYCQQALGDAGCSTDELDERGYCHHLVGFTNDGKVMECIEPWLRTDKNKEVFDTGFKRVSHRNRQAIKPSDVLLNPEFPQVIKGITYMAKRWVSARVYRPDVKPVKKQERPDPEVNPDPFEADSPEAPSSGGDELKEMIANLARAVEATNQRLDAMEEKPKKKVKKQKTAAKPELVEA